MALSLRETILLSAVNHIAAEGPDSLSLRKIAVDAGVSHQAPYHHFDDRRGLFRAIATEGYEILGDALRSAARQSSDVRGEAFLDAYVSFAVEHPGHFRVMFRRDLSEMETSPELRAVADDAFDELVEYVKAEMGPKAPMREIRARIAGMWATAHGLATLLIDGPLEQKIGRITDRRAFVRSVVNQRNQG